METVRNVATKPADASNLPLKEKQHEAEKSGVPTSALSKGKGVEREVTKPFSGYPGTDDDDDDFYFDDGEDEDDADYDYDSDDGETEGSNYESISEYSIYSDARPKSKVNSIPAATSLAVPPVGASEESLEELEVEAPNVRTWLEKNSAYVQVSALEPPSDAESCADFSDIASQIESVGRDFEFDSESVFESDNASRSNARSLVSVASSGKSASWDIVDTASAKGASRSKKGLGVDGDSDAESFVEVGSVASHR